jgi:hypothetical protein
MGVPIALRATKSDGDAPRWGRRFRLPNAPELEGPNMAGETACPTNAGAVLQERMVDIDALWVDR